MDAPAEEPAEAPTEAPTEAPADAEPAAVEEPTEAPAEELAAEEAPAEAEEASAEAPAPGGEEEAPGAEEAAEELAAVEAEAPVAEAEDAAAGEELGGEELGGGEVAPAAEEPSKPQAEDAPAEEPPAEEADEAPELSAEKEAPSITIPNTEEPGDENNQQTVEEPKKPEAPLDSVAEALHEKMKEGKLLNTFSMRCMEARRSPNPLIEKGMIADATRKDGKIWICAPGNDPMTFCNRIDDVDLSLINSTFKPVAKYICGIDLQYNHITNAGAKAFAAKGGVLSAAVNLSSLSFRSNELDSEGVDAICRSSPNLKRLDMSGNPLGKLGGLAVAEYLQNNRILHELHLDDTEIDLDVLVAIAAVLHVNNQTLQVLSIENPRLVNLQGEHTYHFSRMLRVNTGLQEIYLGKHRIRDGDVKIMVSYLMENMTLKVLDLRCNEIGTTGVEALAKWLRTPGCNLKKLNLSANRIGEKDATTGVEALADCLLPNKMLCHLDLNHNRLCSNALIILSQAIDQCETKQIRMNLFHNQWDDAAATAFHHIFADTSRVFPVKADFETHEQGDHIAVTEIHERKSRY